MLHSRFAFESNIAETGTYKKYQNSFWPPEDRYLTYTMDLAPYLPNKDNISYEHLDSLRHCIEIELLNSQLVGRKRRNEFYLKDQISSSMKALALSMNGMDQKALTIRANAVMNGYCDEDLQKLASIRPEISIVAGNISTWYGKAVAGRPTAFGCAVNHETNDAIRLADADLSDLDKTIKSIDSGLALKEAPEFESSDVFFMCGEGNLFPKHFAYFVPEDEGIPTSSSTRSDISSTPTISTPSFLLWMLTSSLFPKLMQKPFRDSTHVQIAGRSDGFGSTMKEQSMPETFFPHSKRNLRGTVYTSSTRPYAKFLRPADRHPGSN